MKMKLYYNTVLFMLLVSLLTVSCAKSGSGGSTYGSSSGAGTTPAPATNTVNIANMSFTPDSYTVKAGTMVTWINKDGVPHTVTADDKSFDSGSIAAGGKFTYTFTTTGSFTYHCSFHPGMTATLTVN
jgi:plastocyanin